VTGSAFLLNKLELNVCAYSSVCFFSVVYWRRIHGWSNR